MKTKDVTVTATLVPSFCHVDIFWKETICLFLVMWWPSGSAYAGQCGDGAPVLDNGKVPQCDPDDMEYHCCSKWGLRELPQGNWSLSLNLQD